MGVRDVVSLNGDGLAGVMGALGAGTGVALSVVLNGNPLLWASAGGVAGLTIGLLVVESS